jgi:hypothetical protein
MIDALSSPQHRRVELPLQAEDEEGTGKSRVLPVGYGADTWSVVPAECPWLDVISGQIEVEADGTLRGGESQHRPVYRADRSSLDACAIPCTTLWVDSMSASIIHRPARLLL